MGDRAVDASDAYRPVTVRTSFRCLVAVLAALAAPTAASAQRLTLRNYAVSDGLPSAQVFTSCQDRRGFLWFGSPGGLARYDGTRFQTFTTENGLVDNAVRSLALHGNDLWVGTEGGVSRFDGERFTSYTARDGLGAGIVWQVLPHGDEVWFATSEGGFTRFAHGRFTTPALPDLAGAGATALLEDEGALWIGTRRGGLFRLRGERLLRVGVEQGLEGTDVRALAKDGEVLWVGTRDAGLFRREGERFVRALPDANVYCVARWKGDLVWGTLGQGLFRMGPRGVERTTTANGLASDRVYSLLTDREGILWATTSKGVSKIVSDALLGHLENRNVLSIARFDGALWFGTLGEGLWRLKDGAWRTFGPADGLSENSVWSLAAFGGRLWVGTGTGLCSSDGSSFRPEPGPAASALVFHLLADGSNLWISRLGGALRFDGERYTAFAREQGLVSDNLRMAAKIKDRVCFAAEGGVSCFNGSGFETLGVEQGLSSPSVFSVVEDSAGTLWAATARGLNKRVGDRFVSFGTAEGLPSDYVVSVREYRGALWLGTRKGLAVFDGTRTVRTFDQQSGLLGSEFNISGLLADEDGTLWIGTNAGATQYLPARDTASESPPPIVLERFTAGGQAVAGTGAVLGHRRNNVDFDYVAPTFRDEGGVSFRFQLEGFDADWSAPTRDRQVRYTNLPAGAYTFRVSARTRDGLQSAAPASVSFVIRPPVWGTWWFRALATGALVGAVLGAIRLRLRQLRRRTEELERLVQERTHALASANLELKNLSLTDPLTRLGNRRLLAEVLPREVEAVRRSYGALTRRHSPSAENSDIGFILVDIDHFKAVNDEHGHEAGDALLQQVAERLRGSVRAGDLLIRWGGEEFLLVCKHVNRHFLHEMAGRVAQHVRQEAFALPQGPVLQKTCSVGFSLFPFAPSQFDLFDVNDVIGFADAALYLAKQNGRDLVVGVFPGEAEIPEAQKAVLKANLAGAVARGWVRVACDREGLSLQRRP